MLKFLQFGGDEHNWTEMGKDLKEKNGGNFLSWELQVPRIE